jgi:hypothetical protein
MNLIRYLGVALLFAMGCQGTPTVTRSGEVKDIIIADNLVSGDIAVSVGDEVRWVNKGDAPVRIVFLDPVSDKQLSCKNNDGQVLTMSETARLETGDTASVCFRDPGYYRYTVRMESARTRGELKVPGVVIVGERVGRFVGSQNDQSGDRVRGLPNYTPSVPH